MHPQHDPAGTPYRSGGGVWTSLVVGYTWKWASLGFPTGLVLIELRSWSTLEGRGVRWTNLRVGSWRRSSLHRSCGPSPPLEVAVAGGAAHVNVDDIGGGVEGGCPAHDVIHPQCPRLVRCLLQLMVGNGEGLVVGEGVGCGVGARGQACGLRHSLLGHC